MKCPVCGTQLDENAKECFICGYKLDDYDNESPHNDGEKTAVCPKCGAPLDKNASFCTACGTKLNADIGKNADVTVENKSKGTIKDDSSKPASDSRSDFSGIDSSTNNKVSKQKNTMPTDQKPKQRRTGLIVVLIIIIIVVVVFLVLYFTGVISFGDRENSRASSTESTAVEEGEGSANVAPNTSYIGYWNISGSEEEELTISSVTSSTVGFSLWWRDLFRVDNATAYINEDNIAAFSCEDSGMKMAGNLTFYEDYIIVQITESNIDYVDTGTMVFNEKHLEAWSDAESTNASTSSSSSSDSSAASSGSTSNQNSSTASSGSNSNSSTYYYNGDYVLPNSSSQLLTYADIQGLTSDELRLARNEIYARHGRKFDDNALQSYFNSKSWYSGTIDPDDFSQGMLSSIERSNIAFIESYE